MLVALCLAGWGCGLTLDLELEEGEGPDFGVVDSGADPVDQGPRDSGRVDAEPGGDLGPTDAGGDDLGSVDQGPIDAGPSDLGLLDLGPPRPCRHGADCPGDQYCLYPEGRCLGEGRCVDSAPALRCVDLPEAPVCGCDYRTYQNRCEAELSGVSVAFEGACPPFGTDDPLDWCARTAPAQVDPGCIPCFDDADCRDGATTASTCVGSTCRLGGAGLCAFTARVPDCYYDFQCGPVATCQGAVLRACDDPTGVTSSTGRCTD